MIGRTVRLAIAHEEEEGTMLLSDLRKFMKAADDAPDDVRVEVRIDLIDGRSHDILEASWEAHG